MTSALTKSEDGTITLAITIPWEQVQKAREEVVSHMAQNTTLPGFRKGKAPQKLVEENLDQEKIREETLKKLLPRAYTDALEKHTIKPIMHPRIHVQKLQDNKDWEFSATTCESPQVDLNHYKDTIQRITAKSKIVIPGQEQTEVKFDDIVKALLENVKVTIPQVLVEQEVDRLLAQSLDEIKKLGLSLDQYLSSTNRTPESFRKEYQEKAANDIKLEFVLQKIAIDEKISVEEKEIDEAIAKSKSDEERKQLQSNRYLLASILRQQKTLDFLRNV